VREWSALFPPSVPALAMVPPRDDGSPDLDRLPLPIHCAECQPPRFGYSHPRTLAVARWGDHPLIAPPPDAAPDLYRLRYEPTRKVRAGTHTSDGSPVPQPADIVWRDRLVLAKAPSAGTDTWTCARCKRWRLYKVDTITGYVQAAHDAGDLQCFLPLRGMAPRRSAQTSH